jgi:hypothetical protein
MNGHCQRTFKLSDLRFRSIIHCVRSQPFHCDVKVSGASEHDAIEKNLGLHSLGESTSPGPGGWGENLPGSALPIDSLLALNPLHIHDREKTAWQLLILIHETHTIADLIKFRPDPENRLLNNA